MGIIKTLWVALMAVTMFTQAGGVDALQYKSMSRTNGTAAFGVWSSQPEPGVYTDTYVAANKTKTGTEVYFDQCTYDSNVDVFTCRGGWGQFGSSVFSIDRKLQTAALSPVSLEVWDWDGNMTTVTVDADWLGDGPLQRGVTNVMDRFGDTMFKFHANSTFRDATATANLDGSGLGDSSFAGMVQYRTADFFMVR